MAFNSTQDLPTSDSEPCRNCGETPTYAAYNRWLCAKCLKEIDKRNGVNSKTRRQQVEDALPKIGRPMSYHTNVKPGLNPD